MSEVQRPSRPLRAWHMLLWLIAAIASTMCGIGGGLFAVPILHFLLGLPLKTATATSLVSVFAMTLAGTLAELMHPQPALNWPVVACLCLGGLVGARVGQFAAQRIAVRTLTWILAIVLSAAGIRLLLSGEPVSPVRISLSSLDPVHALIVIALGFIGGFVAPILGVGGGLFVVPGLVLQGLGYLSARACSTAMAAVNSAQLTWMNLRAGSVQRSVLLPFSAVAVLGAVIGISLVHRPGWAASARLMLGALLLFSGAKFGWSALRQQR